MKSKTKSWSRRKLLKFSVLSVLLSLLFAEGVARLFFYYKFYGLHTSVYIQGSPIQQDDEATVYNNRPFYTDYEKKFQYNECGMKSACGDFQMPVKKEGDLWILLLGGSAMEGMGSNKEGKWLDITNVTDHPYSETIAAILQDMLREKYPSRNIFVFNAAVSGFTIEQGFLKYVALSKTYNFDWVISMDGVNEPSMLRSDESGIDYKKKYWSTVPFRQAPLKYIIPITRHSALFNTLKQQLYYIRLNARMNKNKTQQFPERRSFLQKIAPPLVFADSNGAVKNATDTFAEKISRFSSRLRQDGKKYLLLVQPYLAFREPSALSEEERALTNYLRDQQNDKYKQLFLKTIYDSFPTLFGQDLHLRCMNSVNRWPGWTFVDYCHFTTPANKRIAGELADFIISNGKIDIFVN